MKIESRSIIHAGVGFVMTPFSLERSKTLSFQQRLLSIDSNFSKFEMDDTKFMAASLFPVPILFEVRLELMPAPNVGRLVIVATNLVPSADSFATTADYVAQAYQDIWGVPGRQVLMSEVTLRDLYDTEGPHAFMEIWERRLERTSDELRIFDRPVIGGGVRFVLAPREADQPVVDLRIESQLNNPSKILIEVQCAWQNPAAPGSPLNPSERFHAAQEFAKARAAQWFSAEARHEH